MPSNRLFPVRSDTGDPHASEGRMAISWDLAQRVYQDFVYLEQERGHAPEPIENIANRGGWGWNEMWLIVVRADEARHEDPDETKLTERAQEAFNDMTTRPPGFTSSKTGGAW